MADKLHLSVWSHDPAVRSVPRIARASVIHIEAEEQTVQETLACNFCVECYGCIAIQEKEFPFASVNGISLEFGASVTALSFGTDLSLMKSSSNCDVPFHGRGVKFLFCVEVSFILNYFVT